MMQRLMEAKEENVLRLEIYKMMNEERKRQDARWGVQDHDIAGVGESRRELYKECADEIKNSNDRFVLAGLELSWDTILLEEIYEVFSAESNEERVEELVQVLAVGMEIIENIIRRKKAVKEKQE